MSPDVVDDADPTPVIVVVVVAVSAGVFRVADEDEDEVARGTWFPFFGFFFSLLFIQETTRESMLFFLAARGEEKHRLVHVLRGAAPSLNAAGSAAARVHSFMTVVTYSRIRLVSRGAYLL